MSLEQSILELTDAVKLLTATLAVHGIATAPEVVQQNVGLTPDPKADAQNTAIKKREKKIVEEEISEAKKPETSSESTSSTIDASENESAPVTYDDVKKATNALSAAKGRDVTIDALSRFGVKRATELDEGQWADYIAYTETVIADE